MRSMTNEEQDILSDAPWLMWMLDNRMRRESVPLRARRGS